MKTLYRYGLTESSDGLKKLILENPELPIVVLAGEDANIGSCYWMFCSSISYHIEEILDCDYLDDDDTVFVDRDWFEEKVAEDMYDECADMTDEEFEAVVKARIAEYEPYWTKVIAIYATN